jgi:hypothetical protein
MDELNEERYVEDLTAIAECVSKGVSERAVLQLAGECGIAKQDLDVVLNFRVTQ